MDNFFYHPCTRGSGLIHIEDVGQVEQVVHLGSPTIRQWESFHFVACECAARRKRRDREEEEKAAKFSFAPPPPPSTSIALLERKRIHAANSGSSHPNIRKLKRARKAVVEFAICHLLLEGHKNGLGDVSIPLIFKDINGVQVSRGVVGESLWIRHSRAQI